MAKTRPEKLIRDAVHGDMVFDSRTEMAVIDTPEVQRLRGVKQLGTASLVYPTATHTRFDHSLGTCWIAKRILAGLREKGVRASDEEREAVALAALLHDVTHIPFGHTFEDERRLFERHDAPERVRAFLARGQAAKVLRSLGSHDAVLSILTGRRGGRPFLRQIVAGTICADLLDYLARDALFCGLSQRYDERIFRYFSVVDGELVLEAQKDGIVRADALSEIVNLLRLRYFLSERVYFHHAKTASGAMVSKAVELCLARGLTLADLFPLKDEGLFQYLRARFGRDRTIEKLLDRIETRRIYKRAYVLTRKVGEALQGSLIERYHADRAGREKAEAAIERRGKLEKGDVVVYCPSAGMSLKEAEVPLRLSAGRPRPLSELGLPEVEELRQKHRNLWKFYVFVSPERPEAVRDAARAAEEYFALPNELVSLQSGQSYLSWAGSEPERAGARMRDPGQGATPDEG
ncbi:MAG: HD domain-containing protein [Planctomycetes bacterium]|nr:HD domain-containing protein [Planctomycetota bacterium]